MCTSNHKAKPTLHSSLLAATTLLYHDLELGHGDENTTMALGQPNGLSKEACLYTDTDWLNSSIS